MSTKKKETDGDIVMHVHEKIAQVTVKRTVKNGENYESREVMLQKGVNGSAGEAYETIIETERALSEMLDDMFGDMVFEKDKAPKEIVEESFGDEVEELEVEDSEELEIIDVDAELEEEDNEKPPYSTFFIIKNIWYQLDRKGKTVRFKNLNNGNPFPMGTSWEDNQQAYFQWLKRFGEGKVATWPMEKQWDAYREAQKMHRLAIGEDYVYEPRG